MSETFETEVGERAVVPAMRPASASRAESNGTRSSHRIITYVLLAPFFFVAAQGARDGPKVRSRAGRDPAVAGSRRAGCTKLAGLLHRRVGPPPVRARRCGDSRAGAG
ncbi:hypothetical protein FU139_22370, partial [Burkholderia territorii]